MDKTEYEVWAAVREMNRCWTCGDQRQLARLSDYFHEGMVAITPADPHRIEGREACLAGWSNFAGSVTIHRWTENDIRVQVYKETAIVTYYYDLSGEAHGSPVSLAGRDMLTLIKEDGRWQLVANHFSPFPQQGQGGAI